MKNIYAQSIIHVRWVVLVWGCSCINTVPQFLVLWSSSQRPQMNGQCLQFSCLHYRAVRSQHSIGISFLQRVLSNAVHRQPPEHVNSDRLSKRGVRLRQIGLRPALHLKTRMLLFYIQFFPGALLAALEKNKKRIVLSVLKRTQLTCTTHLRPCLWKP